MAYHPPVQFKEEYCEMLIKHIGEDNCSFESFGAVVKCGKDTLYKWMKEIPEFAKAREIGEAMDLKFCENILKAHIIGVKNEKFNSRTASLTALIFRMKTRHYKLYGDLLKHELAEDAKTIFQLAYKIDDTDN